MKQKHPIQSIRVLCEVFGLTRQAYYKAKKWHETQEEKNQLVLKKIRKIREEMPGLGTRKLHYLTVSFRKKHDIKMGRDKMYDLLRKENYPFRQAHLLSRDVFANFAVSRYESKVKGDGQNSFDKQFTTTREARQWLTEFPDNFTKKENMLAL